MNRNDAMLIFFASVKEKTILLKTRKPKWFEYIDKNKQLPNMPNAAEVKENGLGIGALQTKLVEKIEELTLYIIELENRMSTIENKGGLR